MEGKYIKPMAEKIEFNYTEQVAAASNSQGHKYRLYTDGYYACHETATDIWVDEPPAP